MNPTIFTDTGSLEFKTLNPARKSFIEIALGKPNTPAALVIERNMYFEVTFTHNEKLVHEKFGKLTQATAFVINCLKAA